MPIRPVEEMVREAKARIRNLSIAEAQALHGRTDTTFVDIRDLRELQREGVIPGALHAPRGLLEFWVDPSSPYFKPVFGQPRQRYVLFCAAGWRSALSTATLQDMGLDGVCHIEGGFEAWKAAGGAVSARPEKSPRRQPAAALPAGQGSTRS
jgi:rhodanese-related sulfurtransferase